MFLTLYYILATYLQAWRIKSICTKIRQKLADKTSVVFYNVPSEVNDISTTTATSDLCTNRALARISDVMWLRGSQRGCSLVPMQKVFLGPWVSFPDPPNLLPFEVSFGEEQLEVDQKCAVHLLLETDIVPSQECDESEAVMVEHYGRPLAWKVDSHFAILLESDVHHFTKLVMTTFMQNNLIINDKLPLLRIESIICEGEPQPFHLLKNHLRKQQTCRAMRHLNMKEWEKHLTGLRSLSILANQATEYEYNKNRTEGKSGIVKPDLIPSKKIDDVEPATRTSPARSLSPKQIEPDEIVEIKHTSLNDSKHSTPHASPMKSIRSGSSTPLKSSTTVDSGFTSQPPPETNRLPEVADMVTNNTTREEESVSVSKDHTQRPPLVRKKGSLSDCKPPNVVVYSESISARDSAISTLKDILEVDVYTIYPLTAQQAQQRIWMDNTCLLIICGPVKKDIGNILLDYFLKGGKVLSLCSDMLHIILPTYRTAEVREHELVQFSYGKWQKVKMMHHIFCYQPSPVKKHFSNDSDEPTPPSSKKPALVCPRSIEVQDLEGEVHSLDVKVLGTEETWNTPSLLLASSMKTCGKFVFSQVHLESDPSQFEADESKYAILKQNNKARLEIFSDLLKSQLNINVKQDFNSTDVEKLYKAAYFLGRHESKFELLDRLKSSMVSENMINTPKLNIKFCDKNETPPKASSTLLPIMIHSCPEDFSTVDYFDNLKSNNVGRLVIYAPIMTSSMHIINGLTLTNGIAVIPRRQTSAQGRTSNQWLSPEGCLMFSLQFHIPLETVLGQHISIFQHLIGVAMIHSIINEAGYKNIDIGLKWPNDIYANGVSKIGGILVNAQIVDKMAICNAGCAINLSNSKPTTCVNDLIKDYNRSANKNLPLLTYEKTLASIFTEIEYLMDKVQNEGISQLKGMYYRYWLHSNQDITIMDASGDKRQGKISEIDDYGFLKVQLASGRMESVQPDGNSFDMLRGLILPK